MVSAYHTNFNPIFNFHYEMMYLAQQNTVFSSQVLIYLKKMNFCQQH